MMRVGCAVGRDEIDQIESLCQKALTRDPDDYFALEVLADAYWRGGLYDKAFPIALRILEYTPNDFNALRIVVHAYTLRGDNENAYPFVKLLCDAIPYTEVPYDALTNILKPLNWMPVIRRFRQYAIDEQEVEKASRANWLEWARDYVGWFESQSAGGQ